MERGQSMPFGSGGIHSEKGGYRVIVVVGVVSVGGSASLVVGTDTF